MVWKIAEHKHLWHLADIYVSLVSHTHQVAAKGWFIAMVSSTVETDNPEAEIKPGLDLLGPIAQKFVSVSDVYRPIDLGSDSQVRRASDIACQQFFVAPGINHFIWAAIGCMSLLEDIPLYPLHGST